MSIRNDGQGQNLRVDNDDNYDINNLENNSVTGDDDCEDVGADTDSDESDNTVNPPGEYMLQVSILLILCIYIQYWHLCSLYYYI